MENQLLYTLNKEEKRYLKTRITSNKEILHFEGDKCNEISIVISGKISIISNKSSGKEIIYNILNSGDVFGNNLVFSSKNIYKGNVIAEKNSTIVSIKIEDLIFLLQHNEKFLLEYLRIQSDFGKSLNGRIKILISKSCKEKFLTYLAINGGKTEIKSITNLSKELNVSRENLSRVINKLIINNVIKKEAKNYSLIN